MTEYTLKTASDLYMRVNKTLWTVSTLKTAENAMYHALEYFGEDAAVSSIGFLEIELFKAHLFETNRYKKKGKYTKGHDSAGPLSTGTIKQVLIRSRAMFSWLVKAKAIKENPFTDVKLPKSEPKKIHIIEQDEWDAILKEAGRSIQYREHDRAHIARNIAFLMFFASTGCRVGGAVSAQISSIQADSKGGFCMVTEKGDRTRPVPLTGPAIKALNKWLKLRPDVDHDYIFTGVGPNDYGNPITTDGIRTLFKRLSKRAGVKHLNPHRIRHTCSVRWQEQGLSAGEVAQILGNGENVVKKHYSRFSIDRVLARHAGVSWIG